MRSAPSKTSGDLLRRKGRPDVRDASAICVERLQVGRAHRGALRASRNAADATPDFFIPTTNAS